MLRANQEKYESLFDVASMSIKNNNKEEWNKTAVILVNGVARIFTQNLEILSRSHESYPMWSELLRCLKLFLDRQVLSISTSVFLGLTEMLEEVDNAEAVGKPAIDEAWTLWNDCNPGSHSADAQAKNGNQDALLAYLRCIPQIYRLLDQDTRNEHASSLLQELHSCVVNAELPAYSNDFDRMTPVQKGVLEDLKIIPTNQKTILSQSTEFLATLVVLPYKHEKSDPGKGPTFLALSRAAIASLQVQTISHATQSTVESCELVAKAFNALAVPIHLKYSWRRQGKVPSTWKAATTAAVEILEACMPIMIQVHRPEEEVDTFWEKVVGIVDGIVSADCESCLEEEDIPIDQDFDVDALSRFQKLITPALGISDIPERIRRKYVESMFEKSLIHEPHPDDLARPGQELLEGLKYDHIGRTQDLPATLRSRMSYVLLDELFDLTAVHDGSAERIRLAQAAAPYMILRCGLALKAYVYDQPLRGRMPQPWSQKKELLYILHRLADIDLEPQAIQDVHGVTSDHKKHLFKLYPLLTRALKAAFRDQKMTDALGDVLEVMGQDFAS